MRRHRGNRGNRAEGRIAGANTSVTRECHECPFACVVRLTLPPICNRRLSLPAPFPLGAGRSSSIPPNNLPESDDAPTPRHRADPKPSTTLPAHYPVRATNENGSRPVARRGANTSDQRTPRDCLLREHGSLSTTERNMIFVPNNYIPKSTAESRLARRRIFRNFVIPICMRFVVAFSHRLSHDF